MKPSATISSIINPLGRPGAKISVLLLVALVFLMGSNQLIFWMKVAGLDYVTTLLINLVLNILIVIPILVLLWLVGRRERERRWLFLLVFAFGTLAAYEVGFTLNYALRFNDLVSSILKKSNVENAFGPLIQGARFKVEDVKALVIGAIVGPLFEELAKGSVILLTVWLWKGQFFGVRDGIVYGALVGLGFAAIESAYSNTQITLEPLVRAFFHSGYSALFGAVVGASIRNRGWLKRVFMVFGGLMLAMFAHFLTNASQLIEILIVGGVLGIKASALDGIIRLVPTNVIFQCVFLYIVLHWFAVSVAWEHDAIREQLKDETSDVVSPEEYKLIQTASPFSLHLRRYPNYSRNTSKEIVNAQNQLALRKFDLGGYGAVDPSSDVAVATWHSYLSSLRHTASG